MRRRPTAGEACDGANDCTLLACISAPGSATCTDQLCQCQSGSYCTSNDQCVGTCAGSSCRAINTVCDTGDAADCTGAFTCVSKRCVLPEGSACTANSVCQNACRAQVCAALGTKGQVCDETADCSSGLACSKTAGTDGNRTCLLDIGAVCSAASRLRVEQVRLHRHRLHQALRHVVEAAVRPRAQPTQPAPWKSASILWSLVSRMNRALTSTLSTQTAIG